jgi:hypothetical protein
LRFGLGLDRCWVLVERCPVVILAWFLSGCGVGCGWCVCFVELSCFCCLSCCVVCLWSVSLLGGLAFLLLVVQVNQDSTRIVLVCCLVLSVVRVWTRLFGSGLGTASCGRQHLGMVFVCRDKKTSCLSLHSNSPTTHVAPTTLHPPKHMHSVNVQVSTIQFNSHFSRWQDEVRLCNTDHDDRTDLVVGK